MFWQTLSFSNWGICLNFNYFAILLFGLSLAVIIIASFVFPGQDKEQIAGRLFNQCSDWVLALLADFSYSCRLHGVQNLGEELHMEFISPKIHRDAQYALWGSRTSRKRISRKKWNW